MLKFSLILCWIVLLSGVESASRWQRSKFFHRQWVFQSESRREDRKLKREEGNPAVSRRKQPPLVNTQLSGVETPSVICPSVMSQFPKFQKRVNSFYALNDDDYSTSICVPLLILKTSSCSMSWRKWQDANQKLWAFTLLFFHFLIWSIPVLDFLFLFFGLKYVYGKPWLLFSPCYTFQIMSIWSDPHLTQLSIGGGFMSFMIWLISYIFSFFFFFSFFLDVLTRVVTCIKCMVKIYFFN